MSDPPTKKRLVEQNDGSQKPVGGDVEMKDGAEMAEFFEVVDLLLGKARERLEVWDELLEKGSEWFFDILTEIDLSSLPASQASNIVLTLIEAYGSLEKEVIRSHFLPRASVPLFLSLSDKRREFEIAAFPKLKKPLARMAKQVQADPEALKAERTYFPNLVASFLERVDQSARMQGGPNTDDAKAVYILCCRYLEFFIDLLSQMPTRRFLHAYLDDINLLVYCKQSILYKAGSAVPNIENLFHDLVDALDAVMSFPVDNQTAEALGPNEVENRYCARAMAFQRIAYKDYPVKMKAAAMCNISTMDERVQVKHFVQKLSDGELRELCDKLAVVDAGVAEKIELKREILMEALVDKLSRKPDQSDLNKVGLYPDETMMFSSSLIPSELYSGDHPYALPKLNLQFLSLQDYLLRNFKLIQLESAYEVYQDIEDAIRRTTPTPTPSGAFRLQGMHRMALPISSMQIVKVTPPPIGFTMPGMVRAEVHYNLAGLGRYSNVKAEWDGIRQHDILIFVKLMKADPSSTDARKRLGVEYVRGGEVVDVRDDDGNVMSGYDAGVKLVGDVRHARVGLDPVVYQKDAAKDPKIYEKFDLMIRRRPQENNFKAVLDSIRDLMHNPTTVPKWLHDVFLGYGDADSAHYTNLEGSDAGSAPELSDEDDEPVVIESALTKETDFLYKTDVPRKHDITFSEQQATAIKTALHPGLSLVVGPPGTGKTDVAVQIITNLYHKYPQQNTLIITHSNAALNDIFTKVMMKDVDERHLLRLGTGEKDLETAKDFSRWGRVNYMLERRLTLLERVERLCEAIGIDKGFGETCEAAGNFFAHHVETRWVKFVSEVEQGEQVARRVVALFPFEKYFADADTPLWEGAVDFAKAMKAAHRAFDHLKRVFAELDDCRAFELLRSSHDRGNYLLAKQARVIAMTCTHAALKRHDFLKLNFRYDNLIMEEAAQVLEVETFIPMVLQKPLESGKSRLKRVVLIGDHHQLPPVVKNPTFDKYCNMGQSMFTRFIRLGVPFTQLDAQGRMRPQLANVFRWRYANLKDLPHISSHPSYLTANGGFSSVCQCIDVPNGAESQPQPYFYQNLQEAEYVVSVFMLMRLLGYESGKITILTTYNGQKHLIKDVLNFRCRQGSIYGDHPRVSTVDKYQGQQNDYILLSLVRTEKVGHLRDVRRLVVALSRARLGMYVFCKVELFKDVWELRRAFAELLKAPCQLELCTDEVKCVTERAADERGKGLQHQKITSCEQLQSLVKQLESVLVTEEMRKRAAAAAETRATIVAQQTAEEKAHAEQIAKIFSPSECWEGPRNGWYFGTGPHGLGYYLDTEGAEYHQRMA
eukprot:TRINITY_DN5991_c1_g3_i1.p1 TRINITY_DN5991_c1_g3~~TRINITY_DN5991_c1_g3_i1.p1  ORF type:complete len:1329 (+),score=380.49 TRINITY_DN5991_c1_g3_i1:128-4114(+)